MRWLAAEVDVRCQHNSWHRTWHLRGRCRIVMRVYKVLAVIVVGVADHQRHALSARALQLRWARRGRTLV